VPKPKLTVKDKGFKRVIAVGKELAGRRPHVRVGFFHETETRSPTRSTTSAVNPKQENLLTNIELAVILNYGSEHIPPRRFFQNAIRRRRKAWRIALGRLGRAHLKGEGSIVSALEALGEKAVAHVQTAIRTIGVPDAPSTLAEKRGSRPLIDSKQLIESIRSKVSL
jgi:hypothetical protein